MGVCRADARLGPCRRRSRVDQMAVSDEKVAEYNQIAALVTYAWDLEINNNGPSNDSDIIKAICGIDKQVVSD